MKKKYILILLVLILSIALYVTESPIFRFDRYGNADIDWIDGIFYENQFYGAEYENTDNWEQVTLDENLIHKLLGKVKFKLNDNVSNGNYTLRNWDATFLVKGTQIYSIKNIDTSKSIAVLKDGIYIKYTCFESK